MPKLVQSRVIGSAKPNNITWADLKHHNYVPDSVWTFDHLSKVPDIGPAAWNGNANVGATMTSSNTVAGRAQHNSAGTNYISAGAHGTDPGQSWVMECFFRLDVNNSRQHLMGWAEAPGSTNADRRLQIYLNTGTYYVVGQLWDGTADRFGRIAVSNFNQYDILHAVVSADGSNIHLAVNGLSSTSAAGNGGDSGYASAELVFHYGNVLGAGGTNGNSCPILYAAWRSGDYLTLAECVAQSRLHIGQMFMSSFPVFVSPTVAPPSTFRGLTLLGVGS